MKSFKRQKTLDFYVKSGKTESTPSSVIFSTSICNEPSTASVVLLYMMTFVLIPHSELIVHLHLRNLLLLQQFQMKKIILIVLTCIMILVDIKKNLILPILSRSGSRKSILSTKELCFSFFQA